MTGKIITIAQQKGGSGKTTLAANLAVQFASEGSKTAIIDTDPQGSLGRWYMTRRERMGDDVPEMGFRTASAWGAKFEAQELAKSHDLVLIDTPPKMGLDGRSAFQAADLILVPVTASQVDLWATEPVIAMAEQEQKPVLMVLNRAGSRTNLTAEIRTLIEDFSCGCASAQLGNRVLFAETLGLGLAATEKQRTGPAAAEISTLANEVGTALGLN